MSADTVARLKIALDDVEPKRIEVPLTIRLDLLYLTIQRPRSERAPDNQKYFELLTSVQALCCAACGGSWPTAEVTAAGRQRSFLGCCGRHLG
jgi:hypothetical protein